MKNTKKILRTLLSVGSLSMVAIAPIAIETSNTEKVTSKEPMSTTSDTPITVSDIISTFVTAEPNYDWWGEEHLVEVSFAYYDASGSSYVFENAILDDGTVAPTPLKINIVMEDGTTIPFDGDIESWTTPETSAYLLPKAGENVPDAGVIHPGYGFIFNADDVSEDYWGVNSVMKLEVSAYVREASASAGDATFSEALTSDAIPKDKFKDLNLNDPNDAEAYLFRHSMGSRNESVNLSVNINRFNLPTEGWVMGEPGASSDAEKAVIRDLSWRSIYADPVADSWIDIPEGLDGYTITSGNAGLGDPIPSENITLNISLDNVGLSSTDDIAFQISVQTSVYYDPLSGESRSDYKNQYAVYLNNDNDTSILLKAPDDDLVATPPAITNVAPIDKDGLLKFTAKLNSFEQPAAELFGRIIWVNRIKHDSAVAALPDDAVEIIGSVPADGEQYAPSYDFVVDTSKIDDAIFYDNTEGAIPDLVVSVAYKPLSGVDVQYEVQASVGSIPRDPNPSVIDAPTAITSDDTNAFLKFNLSDSTRGWEVGPDGVRIKISTQGGVPYLAEGVIFDQALDPGSIYPQEEITATIPMTNFPVDDQNYSIQILSSYEIVFYTAEKGSYYYPYSPPISLTSDPKLFNATNSFENLVATPGANPGTIDLSWVANYIVGANPIYYFAVRNTLLKEEGWKIYSSEQSNITMNAGGTVATIEDPNFIVQGGQYDISLAVGLEKSDPPENLIYDNNDVWAGWDGGVSGSPLAVIEIVEFTSGFATPTTPPDAMGFTYSSSTFTSLTYDFTYDNGSLEFNPVITVEVKNNTVGGEYTLVTPSDISTTFDGASGTGSLQILRLSSETSYDIKITYDYLLEGYSDTFEFFNAETDVAPSLISVRTNIDLTEGTESIEIVITGSGVDNVIGPGADVIISSEGATDIRLSDTLAGGMNFYGRYAIDISSFTSFTDITVNIISFDTASTPNPIGVEGIIISDEASDETTEVTYLINGVNANAGLIKAPTAITPSQGIQNGEVNLIWDVVYPLAITNLSQLGFVFEITTTDPNGGGTPDWIDVTNQTSNFGDDLKSATINGLNGADYSGGVWVRLTIDYLSIDETNLSEVTSTVSAIPKQPTSPGDSSGLSTGALIGIIIGSLAGVALIGLGGWFYWKKNNPQPPKKGKDGKEPSKPKVKKEKA